MKQYPCLTVDLRIIRENAAAVRGLCAARGVSVAGVIKGAGGALPVARAMAAGGCAQLASSRLCQLQAVRRQLPGVPTMLIRLPQLCEAGETVACCDYSLNSEAAVLRALSDAAVAQGLRHKVILMLESGDLREGAADLSELLELAALTEGLPGLILAGVGTNLNCVSAICPSRQNMQELAEAAAAVESAVGHPLELVSGGSTTGLPLLLSGGMPEKINHLRVGEGILAAQDMRAFWRCDLPTVRGDALLLQAQVIECKKKPTVPRGQQLCNAFGEKPPLPADRGLRRRAIVALGQQDVGDPTQLICLEPGVQVLSASSDHLILDIQDCPRAIQVGDVIGFRMFYHSMLFAFLSACVEKEWLNEACLL